MSRLKHTVLSLTAAAALACAPVAPASAAVPLLFLIGHALAGHVVGAAVRAVSRSLVVASVARAAEQPYADPSYYPYQSAYPPQYASQYPPQYASQYPPQYAPPAYSAPYSYARSPVYYRSAPQYAAEPPAYYARPRVYYPPRAYYQPGVTYARAPPRYNEWTRTAYAPRVRYGPSYDRATRGGGGRIYWRR